MRAVRSVSQVIPRASIHNVRLVERIRERFRTVLLVTLLWGVFVGGVSGSYVGCRAAVHLAEVRQVERNYHAYRVDSTTNQC